MGIFDKMKAAAKNVDSKAGEELDKSKVRSKISDERRAIEELYKKIGVAYYQSYVEKTSPKELNSMCREIDDHKKNIEAYEEEIKDIEEVGKAEREQNKADAEAAAKAREEARAEAKAAKEQAKAEAESEKEE